MGEILTVSIASKEWMRDFFDTTNVRCVIAFKESTPSALNFLMLKASLSDGSVTIFI